MMRRGSGMAGGERPHFTHAVVGGLPTFFFSRSLRLSPHVATVRCFRGLTHCDNITCTRHQRLSAVMHESPQFESQPHTVSVPVNNALTGRCLTAA